MTFTITLGPALLVAFSVLLFVLATALCWHQGLFDGPDTYGVGEMFALLMYALLWAFPSLTAWAIWATWFRSALP